MTAMLGIILLPLILAFFVGLAIASLFLHAAAGTARLDYRPYSVAFRITLLVLGFRLAVGIALLMGFLGGGSLFYLLHSQLIDLAVSVGLFACSLALIKTFYRIEWLTAFKVWVLWCVACFLGACVYYGIMWKAGLWRPSPGGLSSLTSRSGDTTLPGHMQANMDGHQAFASKDYAGALKHFQTALEESRKLSSPLKESAVTQALGNILRVQIAQKAPTEATEQELQALEGQSATAAARAWGQAAVAALDVKDEAKARIYLAALERVAPAADKIFLAQTRAEVGEALLKAGKPKEAVPQLQPAYAYYRGKAEELKKAGATDDLQKLALQSNERMAEQVGRLLADALRKTGQPKEADKLDKELKGSSGAHKLATRA